MYKSIVVVSCLIALAMSLEAQMTETATTYQDTWLSNQGIIAYASLSGGLNIHTHAVDVQITSALGRFVQAVGYLGSGGYASNIIEMPYLESDVGIYTLQFVQRGYCPVAGVPLSIGFASWAPEVTMHTMVYKDRL